MGLSADYTISRYPDASEMVPYELYNLKLAQSKVESARNVFKLLKHRYMDIFEDTNDA